MLKLPRLTILPVLLLLLASFSLQAQEKARLPYAIVADYLEVFKSLHHLDLIVPGMMIMSIDPTVKPPSIEFKILDDGEWETFNPDVHGNIEFPDRPDWMDLTLLSNQPKGTLQLVVVFSARRVEETSVTYQQLMALVPQFEEAMSVLAEKQGQAGQEVKGLTITFAEGTGASVNILSAKRKKTLKSNSAGMVIVHYNDTLWAENPTVEFSQAPIGIMPLQ